MGSIKKASERIETIVDPSETKQTSEILKALEEDYEKRISKITGALEGEVEAEVEIANI